MNEEWQSIKLLQERGYHFNRGIISCSQDYCILDDEEKALDYLCQEWNYSFMREI